MLNGVAIIECAHPAAWHGRKLGIQNIGWGASQVMVAI